jgi:hypothetical protein
MGYTHYFSFTKAKGNSRELEANYQLAIKDCQRIIRRYYKEFGELSGYTAHCAIGRYGGVSVNGKIPNDCEDFALREHFNQNESSQWVKTRRMPYDKVVTACLTVLKHRLGEAFNVSSDGCADDWKRGVEFAAKVTGLKLKNPISKKYAEINSETVRNGTIIAF